MVNKSLLIKMLVSNNLLIETQIWSIRGRGEGRQSVSTCLHLFMVWVGKEGAKGLRRKLLNRQWSDKLTLSPVHHRRLLLSNSAHPY